MSKNGSGGRIDVSIAAIVVEDRARQEFDEGKLIELSESIKEVGIIQPPVVTKHTVEGKYRLVAGERRWRAAMMAGMSVIPVLVRENMSPLDQLVVELHENIGRADLTPMEKIALMNKIHKAKQEQEGVGGKGTGDEGWSIKKTAALFGESESYVAKQIKLAEKVENDAELRKAVEGLELSAMIRKADQIEASKAAEAMLASGEIQVYTDYRNINCLEHIREIGDDTVQAIITDAPFGIPDLEKSRGSTQIYTQMLAPTDNLTADQVGELMEPLSKEMFRVMKETGHLWMFFGWDAWRVTVGCLEAAGFWVCPYPIIWPKAATSAFKGYLPAPCYEQMILAFKDNEKRTRMPKPMKAILDNFPAIHSDNRVHPFQKPDDLIAFLMEQSSNPGDIVYDPFAGVATVPVVAMQMGRIGVGSEINKDHYNMGQLRLTVEGTKKRVKKKAS